MLCESDEKKWLKRFGPHLWDIVNSKDLSIQKLSRLSGVSATALFGWVNGEHIPTVYNLMKVAKTLGVSLEYLVRV